MEVFEQLKQVSVGFGIQILITVILLIFLVILRYVVLRLVSRHAKKFDMMLSREAYVKKLLVIGIWLVGALLVALVWEISIEGLSVYVASIFTVIGIGLFAHWSILSNLTASLLLFFFFPYKIGSRIKILDGENSVEGKIVDITLFYIKLENENKEVFSCPNNLAIQKSIRQS